MALGTLGFPQLGFNVAARSRPQRAYVPPMTEEEEQSLLQQLAGGLQYIAETLDKPGAALRGLVAGEPEQLLNLVPFSDYFGLTDPSTRVYGRELLEKAGMAKNKPGLFNSPGDFAGDVAGFLTEVALDPLNMITGPGRALTATGAKAFGAGAGKTAARRTLKEGAEHLRNVATKIGDVGTIPGGTPRAMAQEIREGYRGVASLGMPWPFSSLPGLKQAPRKVFGAGSETAAKAWEKLHYGQGPVSKWVSAVPRATRMLFSPSVRGKINATEQWVADASQTAARNLGAAVQDVAPIFGRRMAELREFWDVNLKQHGLDIGDEVRLRDFDDVTTHFLESDTFFRQKFGSLKEGMKEALEEPDGPLSLAAMIKPLQNEAFTRDFHEVLDAFINSKNFVYNKVQELGAHYQDLADSFADHFPRRASKKLTKGALQKHEQRLLSTAFPFALQRTIRDVPGGTLTLNRAATDDLVRGLVVDTNVDVPTISKLSAEQHKGELRAWLEQQKLPVDDKATLVELQQAVVWEKHLKPALQRMEIDDPNIIRRMKETVTSDVDVPNLLDANRPLFKAGETTTAKAREIVDWLAGMPKETVVGGVFDRPTIESWFDYMKHLSNSYGSYATIHNFLRGIITDEPADGLVPLRSVLSEPITTGKGVRTRTLLSKQGQERLVTDWWKQQGKDLAGPDVSKALDNAYVPVGTENVLRAHIEATRPETVNAMIDAWDGLTNLWKWTTTIPFPMFHGRNYMAAIWQNWAHGDLPLSGLIKENAAMLKTWLKGGGKESLPYWDELRHGDLLGVKGGRAEFIERLARDDGGPQGALRIGAGRIKDKAVEIGDKAYATVELVNRYVPYKLYRDQGFSVSQAAQKVKDLQYDYSAASPFIRKYGRRLVPFIQWSSKNIPFQIKGLINEPGGRAAQTLRAMASARRESGDYVPSFLRERGSMRIGGTDRAATFLYGFGVPIEDLGMMRVKGGLPSVGETTQRLAAMLHPALQYPLERWAGEQLFSGRKLKTLKKEPSTKPALNQFLSKIPGWRLYRTYKKLTDARKAVWQRGVDFMSGVKFSAYDALKWEAIDTDRALREFLQEHPDVREMRRFYIPAAQRATADPEAIRAELLSRKMQQRIRELSASMERGE